MEKQTCFSWSLTLANTLYHLGSNGIEVLLCSFEMICKNAWNASSKQKDIQCPTLLTFMVEACQSWQGYASCFNQLNQFSIKVVGLLFFGHCFNQFVLYSFTTTMKSPFSWNLFQFNFLAKLHFYIKLHSYGSQFSVIIMINKAM